MIPAFPKPSQIKKVKPAVRVMPSGREVCDLKTKAGRDEYNRRIEEMLVRQNGKCCLQISEKCRKKQGSLSKAVATFEHQVPRGHGGGSRDDRIMKDGKPINGASCFDCNSAIGSRRIGYIDCP